MFALVAPTLLRGDYILADTWHYSESEIAVDDLAVFVAPGTDEVLYMKRVVALPGVRVADGEYFVLGDNRSNSRDSRFFGAVPKSGFVGKVKHLWYSSDDAVGIRWHRFPISLD